MTKIILNIKYKNNNSIKMSKYDNGKIYVIKNTINDKVYIGSTKHTLEHRFNQHKRRIKQEKYKNLKFYNNIIKLNVENFYIELIENYACKSRKELELKEKEYILLYDSINNGYNKVLPLKSKEEEIIDRKRYLETNKEEITKKRKEYERKIENKIKARKKDYREKNKELISEKAKIKREEGKILCDCGIRVAKRDKRKHIHSYMHNYYLFSILPFKLDKIKIIEKNICDKITCICGITVTKKKYKNHLSSYVHNKYLLSILPFYNYECEIYHKTKILEYNIKPKDKEKKIIKNRLYYKNNKDKISNKNHEKYKLKDKIICTCGRLIRNANHIIKTHLYSYFHTKYLFTELPFNINQ